MRAVLLAGGKGTRLYPYTATFPKPLVPLGDKPVLEILIRQLKTFGYDHVTLCVGHLAHLIRAYFDDGKWLGVKIDYSYEERPLGTIGPLKLIRDLPRTFLVANGDLLTTLNFNKILDFHKNEKAILTIGVTKRKEKIELGVLKTEGSRVVDYIEKPEHNYLASCGVYIFEKKVLELVKADEYFDFPQLVRLLLEDGEKIASYLIRGFWLDIGRPDDYQKAIEKVLENKNSFFGEKIGKK